MLTGAALAAASRGLLVLVDGFTVTVAGACSDSASASTPRCASSARGRARGAVARNTQ